MRRSDELQDESIKVKEEPSMTSLSKTEENTADVLNASFARPDFSIERLSGRWQTLLYSFFNSQTGKQLISRIEASNTDVFPPTPFKAVELTPFEKTRVVVIGQDPYNTPGKAEGLAFSVGNEEALPPSLKNIFKELAWEEACRAPVRTTGSLVDWACQGVLLLNTILTVEKGRPLSHAGIGWESLTNELIQTLSREKENLIFILWGKPAQQMRELIDETKHFVITASHPSPFSASRGPEAFMLSRTFTRANDWLIKHGLSPIDWRGPVVEQDFPSQKKTSKAAGTSSARKRQREKEDLQATLF